MMNSIFGAMGQAALTGQGIYQTNPQALQNAPQWMHQASLAQALGAQNQYKPPQWVYNGKACTLKEFTELMWPDDEQARLLFILKHGGA